MDEESFLQGYLTGVALHSHVRPSQLFPSAIASMSVTGVAADFQWFADLSGVEALTALSAKYAGFVTAAYSRDGKTYTSPMHIETLLHLNPATLFRSLNPDAPHLWFRFHLADDAADLKAFTLWGVFARDIPWGGAANAV